MREVKSVEGEYYHVCNRGIHKQVIFKASSDYVRFLFQITHFQSPKSFTNSVNDIKAFKENFFSNRPSGSIDSETTDEICAHRTVELVAFALMPNHFHLLLKESSSNGIPFYLQRTQNGFTKYSNIRYQTSGHILQGPYRIVRIEDNEQLLHVSAYIHRNCRELPAWKNKEAKYPWSSLQDYVTKNRFDNLLVTEPILEQFENKKEYEEFVNSSSAKDDDEIIKEIEQ